LVYHLVKAGVHPQQVKELYFNKPRTQKPKTPKTPRPTPKQEKTPEPQNFECYRKLAGLSKEEVDEIFGDW
jgi:hypothetical protein